MRYPLLLMQGPVSITSTIVALKLGAYGMIRYVASQAVQEFAWLLVTSGAIGILYGLDQCLYTRLDKTFEILAVCKRSA